MEAWISEGPSHLQGQSFATNGTGALLVDPTSSMLIKQSISWLVLLLASWGLAQECSRRKYDEASFVCVCNATYCDSAPSVGLLIPGQAVLITSNRDEARFQPSNLQFGTVANSTSTVVEVYLNASQTYQTVYGFGGAFTDAAGINIAKLSAPAQEHLLGSYFGPDGIEYGMGRVPMAGCDFSIRTYSYDDFPGDVTLSNFSLQQEDLVYKIPYITRAQRMSSKQLKLFGSPWSAPPWMKSNNQFNGNGVLLLEYYQLWAEYFAKFLEEYRKYNIDFWGLTAQNEPVEGRVPGYLFNAMGWNPQNQSLFVGLNLGPTLEMRGFGEVKIMIFDDNRESLPMWPQTVFANPEAYRYTDGIAVHWYANRLIPPGVLDRTNELFPERFLLASEACAGFTLFGNAVKLGSWDHFELYAKDIIEDLNHWVTGWVDWNIALDERGGPNWAGFSADSPIIVNGTADEFYKQPMFYAMGHFSKYTPEGSLRIDIEINDLELFGTAFLRPDGMRTVVLLNRSDNEKVIRIIDAVRAEKLEFISPPRSLHTVVYA